MRKLGVGLEAKVGLFTTIILALLVIGLLWLSGHSLLDRSYQLEVEFSHVGGLRSGAPVQMSGVDIGRVGRVSLNTEGRVLVTLKLKPEVTLRTGTQVTIGTAGLLGEKMVEIIPGSGPEPLLPGARLHGKEPFGLENLLQETGEVLSSIQGITLVLTRLFADEALPDRLQKVATDLETITGNLATFSAELATVDLTAVLNNLTTITSGLARVNYEQINPLLAAAEELPVFLTKLEALIDGFAPFQTELNLFMAELRAEGQTAERVQTILEALEPTATNLATLSTQLTEGEPNLADLLVTTKEMLESVQEITTGLNHLLSAAAAEGSGDLVKSAMEKAGRVVNLADNFLEAYDQLALENQFSLAITPQDWGLNYQAKLAWGTEQFLLFGCDDLGDQNRLSFQFGFEQDPWQFRLGILHNWLGLGLNYNYKRFGLQADLWQPNQPVLDLYARYQLAPFFLKAGLRNLSAPNKQWYLGIGGNL